MRTSIVTAAAAALAASFAFAALPAAARTATNDDATTCTDALGRVTTNCQASPQLKPAYDPDLAGYVAPPTVPTGDPIPPFVGPTPEGGSSH